jgi:hypothetical protein
MAEFLPGKDTSGIELMARAQADLDLKKIK